MDDIQKAIQSNIAAQRGHVSLNLGLEKSETKSFNKGEESDLEKAFNPSYIFNSGANDDIKFQKTGKEIKDKLIAIKTMEEGLKERAFEAMVQHKQNVGIEPEGRMYVPYRVEKISHLLGELPKRYSWEQLRGENSDISAIGSIAGIQQTPVMDDQKRKCAQEYNDCLEKYIEYLASTKEAETLINNLKDEENYTLKADQLTALGF